MPVRGVYVTEAALDEAPPLPRWPADISVRTFVPGRDERAACEAVEDAFKDVWGRPRGTFERFVGITGRESCHAFTEYHRRGTPEVSQNLRKGRDARQGEHHLP